MNALTTIEAGKEEVHVEDIVTSKHATDKAARKEHPQNINVLAGDSITAGLLFLCNPFCRLRPKENRSRRRLLSLNAHLLPLARPCNNQSSQNDAIHTEER
jgi:hypothetical protein